MDESLNEKVFEILNKKFPNQFKIMDLEPSRNLNDAFLLADKLNLFQEAKAALIHEFRQVFEDGAIKVDSDFPMWLIMGRSGGFEFDEFISQGETIPEAICKAIIKLHGE